MEKALNIVLGSAIISSSVLSSSFLLQGEPAMSAEVGETTIGSIQKIDQNAGILRLAVSLKKETPYSFPGLPAKEGDKDTDFDGINDSLDSHPEKATALSNAVYPVPYKDKVYIFRLGIQSDYVDVYKNKMPHDLHRNGDNAVDFVVKGEPYVQSLVSQAKAYAQKDKSVEARALLINLVKSLSYNSDAYTGSLEYPKYPAETLLDRSGDCEDLAILAVNLLGELDGYQSAAIVFFPEHIALGVKADKKQIETRRKSSLPYSNVISGDRVYLYQELTEPSWEIGQLPAEYAKKSAIVYTNR